MVLYRKREDIGVPILAATFFIARRRSSSRTGSGSELSGIGGSHGRRASGYDLFSNFSDWSILSTSLASFQLALQRYKFAGCHRCLAQQSEANTRRPLPDKPDSGTRFSSIGLCRTRTGAKRRTQPCRDTNPHRPHRPVRTRPRSEKGSPAAPGERALHTTYLPIFLLEMGHQIWYPYIQVPSLTQSPGKAFPGTALRLRPFA